ncbi:Cobyric acid synthase [bioreactor metagenome]|uniref:Cobyric acid synthase n=1 Tax=bioreactor metagenome TaxID=1076179 RepID=A0A645G2Z1_9ZZZZ
MESEAAEVRCLGLLPLETVMRKEKTLRRTRGTRADGAPVSGYEIHHGETVATAAGLGIMYAEDGRVIGYEYERLFATYLHGIFDDDRFRRNWLDEVRKRKGWAPKGAVTAVYGIEEALTRLAAHVRSRVDIGKLYKEMGIR